MLFCNGRANSCRRATYYYQHVPVQSTSTTAQVSHKFRSCSCSSYLVCGTTHGWTASHQLATILTDADDNFTRQVVDPGIVLGRVCIFNKLLPPLPAVPGCWTFYCQLELLFHGRQLPRAARQQASCHLHRGQTPAASWFQVDAGERPFVIDPTLPQLQRCFGDPLVA